MLGVCGGYQMLGEMLDDSTGTESGHPQTLRGLGLLPTRTVFTNEKRRTQSTATTAAPFAGAELTGYEIHTGRTSIQEPGAPFCTLADGTPEGCVQGNVFGRPTANSSLTCWPTACAKPWTCPPSTPPWG